MVTKEQLLLDNKRYHDTLLKEREIKTKLVKKIQAIKKVISVYDQNKNAPRSGSKAGGIPFAFNRVVASVFMPSSNNRRDVEADKTIRKIKNLIS